MAQEVENVDKTPAQALQENGMYVFMGEVEHDSIKPIIEWILHENYVVKRKRRELLLMICSEGGNPRFQWAMLSNKFM